MLFALPRPSKAWLGALQGDRPGSRWRCQHREQPPLNLPFLINGGWRWGPFSRGGYSEAWPQVRTRVPVPVGAVASRRVREDHGALRAPPSRARRGGSGGPGRHWPRGQNSRRAAGGVAGSSGAGRVLGEKWAGGLRRRLTRAGHRGEPGGSAKRAGPELTDKRRGPGGERAGGRVRGAAMITSAGEWGRRRRRQGGAATPAFSWVRAGDWAPRRRRGAPRCPKPTSGRELAVRPGLSEGGPATTSGSGGKSRWVDRLVVPPQPLPPTRARTLGASRAGLRPQRLFLNSLPPEVERVGPSDPSPFSRVVRVGWFPLCSRTVRQPMLHSTSRPDPALIFFGVKSELNEGWGRSFLSLFQGYFN